MVKKNTVMITMLFMLLIASSAFAFTIQIKTLPDHRISLILRESEKLSSLESFHQETGTGELKVTSSVTAEPLDILVTLKKDGANIITRKYESVNNENLFLIFIPGDDRLMTQAEADAEAAKALAPPETTQETTTATEAINTDAEEDTAVEKNPEEKVEIKDQEKTEPTTDDKLTSYALLDKLPVDSSLLMKIGIGLLVLIGAVVMIKVVPAFRKEETFTVRPLSELKKEMGKTHADKRIEEIEKKIHDAQRELEALRNHDSRLKEVQDRVKKDQEELRRLQHGY